MKAGLEFEWDPQKAAANLAKHEVSFEEAATAFGDPLGRIVADPRHSSDEDRFVLLDLSRDRRLPSWPHGVSEETMKRASIKSKATDPVGADEILLEYDFSRAAPNKYAPRYAAGSAVVVLEPDVAAAFPSAQEANEALRALAGIIRKHRSRRPPSRRAL
jgi:uncharacterized protein